MALARYQREMKAAIPSRSLALAVSFVATLAATQGRVLAAPDPHCSHDTLAIDGPVAVTLCATKVDPKSISVSESFTRKSASFSHSTSIDVFPGEESSRGIDDVPLAALGLTKTIHLTIHYKAGTIVLEHALLLPGAVPLK
jgi:hypothetical protein